MDTGGYSQVKFMQSFYRSSFYLEYQKNHRLQWMSVAIAAIITLSILKYFSDTLQQERSETQNQIELLARLEHAAKSDTNNELADNIGRNYLAWIRDLPQAASSSVAEAQALTAVEQQFGKLLERKRLNLVGSEKLIGMQQDIWQVRIEVVGQMAELNLIELLQHFDSQHKYARIASFQYSPKTSHSINLVIDLIYIRAEDA
jgi:hypothetical protein